MCWGARDGARKFVRAHAVVAPLAMSYIPIIQSPVFGTGYSWAQTKSELTITVDLDDGCGARDVSVNIAGLAVKISIKGAVVVSGDLHASIAGSVWSVDGRKLNVELEKSRAAFWPCAIRGDPEVDVAALVAREKKEKEPAYKPDPNAEMVPKQVTDKETLRKLKAEFSHLDIPMGPDAHTTTHKNYAGGRKAFDWGALPTDDVVGGESSAAGSSSSSAAKPAATVVATPPASKSVAAASSTNGFEWGALPSTDADKAKKPIIEEASSHLPQTMEEAATDLLVPMKYSWGALPTDAKPAAAAAATPAAQPKPPAPPPPKPIVPPSNAAGAPTEAEKAPAADGPMYSWGALPIS